MEKVNTSLEKLEEVKTAFSFLELGITAAIDDKIVKMQEAVIGSIAGHLEKLALNLENTSGIPEKNNGQEEHVMPDRTAADKNQKQAKIFDANESIISSVLGEAIQ